MKLDTTLLDSLTGQAKANPRLRRNYDLRNSAEDQSQRMLNAMEPGTVIPIHRHRASSELVCVLRGRVRQNFYDEKGNLTETFVASPGTETVGFCVEKGRWHNSESLESGTVILETKDGGYQPLAPEDTLPFPASNASTNPLIIFDLDGTLLNTIADLGNAINHTLETNGLPRHEIQDYKMMVGNGMRNLVKAALPEDKREDRFIDSFLKDFLDRYMEHIDDESVPYPGITELLNKLNDSGFKIAVASNKIQAGAERLMRVFFPEIPFAAVCGNSPDFPLKPDAGLVRYIMDKAGADIGKTIMVGDSEVDIKTAANAGIKSIAVSWGFRTEEYLKAADCIADSAEELLCKIQQLLIEAKKISY